MRSLKRVCAVLFVGLTAAATACVTPPTGGGGTPTNKPPVAVITAAPTSGMAPLSVNFSGGSSTDDGTIVSYEWNLGDGTTATGVTTSHTYPAGTFVVTLTVTDDGGLTDSETVVIDSNAPTDADEDGFFPPADCNDEDPSIHPGALDPAGDGIDQNCDGVDGTIENAVFVTSVSGSDAGTCGAINAPCASIGQGIARAAATNKTEVYVAGGSYAKFTVANGISVKGGYGQNWQRGLLATSPVTATVTAVFDGSVGGPVGIIANGITSPTTVADLKVQGIAASAGQPSYGVHVTNSSAALVLDSLQIIGGTGGAGADGANGSPGWSGPAANGANGGNGFSPGGVCNTSSAGGGGAGAPGAGTGGKGGAVDTSCPFNLDAQPGQAGGNGTGAGGGFGAGGAGGAAEGSWVPGFCGGFDNHGKPGQNGANGANGSPGAGGGAGADGADGQAGQPGRGGGGGGGGGASDCGTDDAGAGGGGGGQGGAAASTVGRGGKAGAPSIALRLVNSSPVLNGVQITLGTGGKGGKGGNGAAGQPGGAGGQGGAAHEDGGAGGKGGNGGTGGASGAGGGGGGGAAIGLSRTASSSPTGTPSFSGGQGGQGGAGGTGSTGGNAGTNGVVQNVHVG